MQPANSASSPVFAGPPSALPDRCSATVRTNPRVCPKSVCAKARQGETEGDGVYEYMRIPCPVSTQYGRVQIHFVQNLSCQAGLGNGKGSVHFLMRISIGRTWKKQQPDAGSGHRGTLFTLSRHPCRGSFNTDRTGPTLLCQRSSTWGLPGSTVPLNRFATCRCCRCPRSPRLHVGPHRRCF